MNQVQLARLTKQLSQMQRRFVSRSNYGELFERGKICEFSHFLRAVQPFFKEFTVACAAPEEESDVLEGEDGRQYAMQVMALALVGGITPNTRPGQLRTLRLGTEGAQQAPYCLTCSDAGCRGNTMTIMNDTSVELRYEHHKNERRCGKEPLRVVVQVRIKMRNCLSRKQKTARDTRNN